MPDAVKRLQARVKTDYRHKVMVLLGGLIFSKANWTAIPVGMEDDARKNHSDILEFSDAPVAFEAPEEKVKLGGNPDQPSAPVHEENVTDVVETEEETGKKKGKRKYKALSDKEEEGL